MWINVVRCASVGSTPIESGPDREQRFKQPKPFESHSRLFRTRSIACGMAILGVITYTLLLLASLYRTTIIVTAGPLTLSSTTELRGFSSSPPLCSVISPARHPWSQVFSRHSKRCENTVQVLGLKSYPASCSFSRGAKKLTRPQTCVGPRAKRCERSNLCSVR